MNFQTVSTRLKAYLIIIYYLLIIMIKLYQFFKNDITIIHAMIISFLKNCLFYSSLFDIPYMLGSRCCIYLHCILKYSTKARKITAIIQYLCIEKAKKLLYFLFNILSLNKILTNILWLVRPFRISFKCGVSQF